MNLETYRVRYGYAKNSKKLLKDYELYLKEIEIDNRLSDDDDKGKNKPVNRTDTVR